MKTANCLAAAMSSAVVLVSGSASAERPATSPVTTPVPTNAAEWFQAGKQVIQINKFSAQAPWQPALSRDYGMLDIADLGDHERDLFVIRLQAAAQVGRVGGAHGY